MWLRLPLDHSVNVKAPGCRWIVKVELELEKIGSYLVQGHCCKLYKSQFEAVRFLSCGLKRFKQLRARLSILECNPFGTRNLVTYAVIKLQAVDLKISLDSVEFVRNAGTQLTMVDKRVRSL